MLPVFAHFSKFSMYAWGKKRKLLVFTAVYVCVKAKLTLVRFFFNFFLCTFPLFSSFSTENAGHHKNATVHRGGLRP